MMGENGRCNDLNLKSCAPETREMENTELCVIFL